MSATVNHERVTVVCNNVPRDTVDACELTPAERADFDYVDWSAIDRGEESGTFVHYRGTWFDLGDVEGPVVLNGVGWDAHISDTFFSGVVFRFVHEDGDDGEYDVVCGRYYS